MKVTIRSGRQHEQGLVCQSAAGDREARANEARYERSRYARQAVATAVASAADG